MTQVRLNAIQLKFVKDMLEIEEGQKAMQKFADLMVEEKLEIHTMPPVVDRCIKAYTERLKK